MRPPRAPREMCNALAFAAGLLAWLVVVQPAHAGDSGAADAFSYGLAEMLAGRYATGCPALEASYRLDPRPGTLFTLAECNLRQGKTTTALADYDQFIALCDRMQPAQQASQAERLAIAKQERASLEAIVPRVTIRVPDSAPLAAPPEALGKTAPPPASRAARRLWIYGAGAAGGLGLLVAGAAGALALSKASTANGDCNAAAVCASQRAADAGNSAHALADVASTALTFAAVGFAVAAVLWISEPSASRSPTVAAIARW